MPIAPEQVPLLIRDSEIKKIEKWKKDYFDKVATQLQVHTKGQLFSKVASLFPNEHPDSRAHCIATYEPITKASIWKGINNLLRIFSSSSFSINVGDDLNKWLEEYEHDGYNLLNYFLQEWVHKAVAEDPNGLFVIYPPDYAEEKDICPVQWVRSELIKSQTKNSVSFISEHDSKIEYQYQNSESFSEVFYDDRIANMNSKTYTRTTYNERLKVKVIREVVHLFTIDGFIIYAQDGEKFETTINNFAEPLTQLPIFSGGGPVADKADQNLFESFVQPFVPFGNKALLAARNKSAIDLSYSYPRMSELQVPCDHKGCSGGMVKCSKSTAYPAGIMPCPECKGKSFITVQSPYKVYTPRYDPNDANNNEHLKIPPVQFFTPDVAIINYAKMDVSDYLKQAEEAIFVMQKVYTGAVESAESKEMDLDELYAWLLNISKVFYNNLRILLQCLEDYISRSPATVSVERPYSFAILTEGEAFVALNGILTSAAPIFIKANRVENFVNKFVSKDSPVNRALEILKQYDTLLFYSNDEISSFKSANIITQEMYQNHVLAYPCFLKLYMEDKTVIYLSDEQIMKKLDKEIAAFKIALPGADFKASILSQVEGMGSNNSLRNSVGGLTGMIEIVKAVASGVYSKQAAAKLISDRFGLTEAQALEQLGDPAVTTIEEAKKVEVLT